MNQARFDLIVFGATSFVGRLVCHYLAATVNTDEVRWAMAGRSRDKLERVKSELGGKAHIIIADAADEASLRALCAQCRVVISTVGPYALFGEPLVKVCAETGTDYCDLTGEIQWIHRMLSRYEATAQKSGARIVHCCGFDSIPSDLGVFFLQQKAKQRFGQYCSTVKMRVLKTRGGLSGGTIASMLNGVREASADPEVRLVLTDPYAICPTGHGFDFEQPAVSLEYDADFHSWAAPFVMAAINTRVVHRSNALAAAPYGKAFSYDEATLCGDGATGKRRARLLNWGLKAFGAAVALPPSRWLLERFVLPKPGAGPDEKTREEGCYALGFVGRTADGLAVTTKVTGEGDPGYASTARMLSQAALCLAFDRPRPDLPGGFWTPATAFGPQLIQRLEAQAGIRFEVLA